MNNFLSESEFIFCFPLNSAKMKFTVKEKMRIHSVFYDLFSTDINKCMLDLAIILFGDKTEILSFSRWFEFDSSVSIEVSSGFQSRMLMLIVDCSVNLLWCVNSRHLVLLENCISKIVVSLVDTAAISPIRKWRWM